MSQGVAHSPDKRTQVVLAYMGLGNCDLVAALCKIPAGTVRQWRTQPWWAELEQELRDEENLKTDKKLTNIVDKTMDLIADRVESGDYVWDSKNQTMVRRPLLARDAVRVASELFDRREFLRKARQEKEINVANVEETLLRVAEQFIQVAKARKAQALDVEFVEVVNEATEVANVRGDDLQDPVPTRSNEGGPSGAVRPSPEPDTGFDGSVPGTNEKHVAPRGNSRPGPRNGLGGKRSNSKKDRKNDLRNGEGESFSIQVADGSS